MRLPERDLELIAHECGALLPLVEGRRLFVTGGTGFFGCWMLESLAWFNTRFGLQTRATILTRSRAAFAQKAPHLANSDALRFVEGDIRALPAECEDGEPYDYVLHMATDTDAASHRQSIRLLDALIHGTRQVLDLAVRSNASGVLITSSGAVYGHQPPELERMPETFTGAPDPLSPASIYGEGKRVSEMLGAAYLAEHGLPVKIARCFAFIGPHLPLDRHFAIGNFIRDALAARPIEISGDGTPYRSYLYAADLTIWLWTILLAAEPGIAFNVGSAEPGIAYNVGSAEPISIVDTARAVATSVQPALPVRIARQADPLILPPRYVPNVQRAETELGLRQTVALPDAIERTLAWHRAQAASALPT